MLNGCLLTTWTAKVGCQVQGIRAGPKLVCTDTIPPVCEQVDALEHCIKEERELKRNIADRLAGIATNLTLLGLRLFTP